MDKRYKNIAISGRVAVGSTTLMRYLQPELEPKGFTFTSIGMMMREMMAQQGKVDIHNPTAEILSEETHRQAEKHVQEMLESGDTHVVEGWLAGFIARDIDHTLKVLVILSDMDERVKRFMTREDVSAERAKTYIQQRETENEAFWKKMYGDHDFWDPAYFDLVIDTAHVGKEEARDRVLEAFSS